MKTIVISIDELSEKSKGYPVHLHFDDGSIDWRSKKRPAAKAVIPENLSVDAPPKDPKDNQPLQPQNLREILLTETDASARLAAVGEYLYKLLFRDDIKDMWEDLSARYPEEGDHSEGRRTILDINAKALRMLPWELMSAGHLPLALDPLNPIIRGPLKTVQQQSFYHWPLHVLIVVGSDDNDPDVNASEEIGAIEDALIKFDKPVEPEILKRPTPQELVDTLKRFRPHIFHFIGHGRKAAGRDDPVLVFEAGKASPAWEWTAGMITLDLRVWKPRFAFINACRSGAEQESTKNWGITEAFIEAGVPAVLGMQADVRGKAAAKFPGELYEALAHDNALDVALATARATVSKIEGDGLLRRDWALATFFLSVAPEKVLDMRPPATIEFRSAINTQFADIRTFVDRVEPRRKLWHGVEPSPSSTDAKRLLMIRGTSDSGKTWLVYWCLRGCRWREMDITYVSLKQKAKTRDGIKDGAKNFLDVLRLIITGSPAHPLGRALMPQAFYEFNAIVNNLLDPSEPAPAGIPAGAAVPDKGLPFREDIDDDAIRNILGAFKIALQRATQNQTLIIALDDLTKAEVRKDHFKNYLLPDLIRPIASGNEESLKNIKMILAVKEDDYDEDLGLPELENLAASVNLDWLAKDELTPFARELCVLKKVPRDKVGDFYNFINGGDATVSPAVLQQLFNLWKDKILRLT